MGLLDKRLGDERRIQLGLPSLDERMLMGPCFTIFRASAEVDGGEGLVVAVALGVHDGRPHVYNFTTGSGNGYGCIFKFKFKVDLKKRNMHKQNIPRQKENVHALFLI